MSVQMLEVHSWFDIVVRLTRSRGPGPYRRRTAQTPSIGKRVRKKVVVNLVGRHVVVSEDEEG